MNDHARATADRDALIDNFAAELTIAAYHVALRHRAADTWLDLQVSLWRALADTVKQWAGESPRGQVLISRPDPCGDTRRVLDYRSAPTKWTCLDRNVDWHPDCNGVHNSNARLPTGASS
jgi:hypothetical protein